MAVQIGNDQCILGTIPTSNGLDEIFDCIPISFMMMGPTPVMMFEISHQNRLNCKF